MAAVMHLLFDPKQQTRKVRPEPEQHARLLGALLCCAKALQRAQVISAGTDDVCEFTVQVELELSTLLESLVGLYPAGDGHRMEIETLGLARLLNFSIEQRHFSIAAGGVH